MTYQLFEESIELYKAYNDWEHKCYELGINFWERDEVSNFVTQYLKLLETICQDSPIGKYDPSNISYFVYDCEFGKKADQYFITKDDGTEVHFNTTKDLWDYLVENHPEIEDIPEESD